MTAPRSAALPIARSNRAQIASMIDPRPHLMSPW